MFLAVTIGITVLSLVILVVTVSITIPLNPKVYGLSGNLQDVVHCSASVLAIPSVAFQWLGFRV